MMTRPAESKYSESALRRVGTLVQVDGKPLQAKLGLVVHSAAISHFSMPRRLRGIFLRGRTGVCRRWLQHLISGIAMARLSGIFRLGRIRHCFRSGSQLKLPTCRRLTSCGARCDGGSPRPPDPPGRALVASHELGIRPTEWQGDNGSLEGPVRLAETPFVTRPTPLGQFPRGAKTTPQE